MTQYIQAWQCIGCGKIEAPQTCIGVCRDVKVWFIGKDEHEAALADIAQLKAQLEHANSMLLRFEHAKPRKGQWEASWQALQAQVHEVRAVLNEAMPAA